MLSGARQCARAKTGRGSAGPRARCPHMKRTKPNAQGWRDRVVSIAWRASETAVLVRLGRVPVGLAHLRPSAHGCTSCSRARTSREIASGWRSVTQEAQAERVLTAALSACTELLYACIPVSPL